MSPNQSMIGDIVPVVEPIMSKLLAASEAAHVLAQSGMAMAGSHAMAELSEESKFVLEDLPEPVNAAHSLGNLFRIASTDAVRQFAKAFGSQPVPVYAYLGLARSALEAAGLAFWAVERGIGVRARVQRCQALQLRDARAMKRSPIEKFKQQGRSLNDATRSQCQQLGWTAVANERVIQVGDQAVPSPKSLFERILSPNQASQPLKEIAESCWWYQSGADHAELYALLQSTDLDTSTSSIMASPRVNVVTNSWSVENHSVIMGLGFRNMIEECRHLFGWAHPDWDAASAGLGEQIIRVASRGST